MNPEGQSIDIDQEANRRALETAPHCTSADAGFAPDRKSRTLRHGVTTRSSGARTDRQRSTLPALHNPCPESAR
jgi:hypothetical protein